MSQLCDMQLLDKVCWGAGTSTLHGAVCMESVLCVSGAEVAQRLCDWNADPKVAP